MAAGVGQYGQSFQVARRSRGYPLEAATAVAVEAVRNWPGDGIDLVRFVCFDQATLAAYQAALGTP